jgi:hypothetical protein
MESALHHERAIHHERVCSSAVADYLAQTLRDGAQLHVVNKEGCEMNWGEIKGLDTTG